ncbi:YncE family protein [Rhodococcus sp. IEGM 1379]|uniref:YncE family protein n=1 Tax=Rhodococcus sp. IEGM 1379 TaxID=3047086 RepID=UPI0024B675B0|nr:YncE family protein [Rhodococcus sp. IEGM 1379]MDI9915922.1 YncE family protein [Rhodococcus sp. IEGM 1379]
MLSTYAAVSNKFSHYKSMVTLAATSNPSAKSPTVEPSPRSVRNHGTDYMNTFNTIELGDNREPYGVAVSPDGKRVYVTTLFRGTVEVIDTATNSVVTSVRVGGIATGVSVTPDGKYVYIGEGHGHIYAMNTSTFTLTTVLASSNYPGKDVAVTPDGRYLYALDNVFNEILVIRTDTRAIAATITLDEAPQSITIARSSGLAYVGTDTASKAPSGSVTLIDTAIHMIVDTIPLADGVKSMFLASDENHVYAVTDTAAVAFDTATHTLVNSTPLRKSPEGVAITPDGRYAYIANSSGSPAAVLTRVHLSESLQTSTLERRGVQPSIGAQK